MSLEVKGKVILICDKESGTSKAGKEWEKQEFVIKTEGDYPKKIAFTTFGDKISLIQSLSVGREVNVSFNMESREYNGRWFHNINAWKIDQVEGQEEPPHQTNDSPPEPPKSISEDSSDLPF